MANKNYFINGVTELLILSILNSGDSYVYEVTNKINELSDGLLNISQNTIYTATYKLENDGMISEYSKLVGKKRTRVYYHLEQKGVLYLKQLYNNYNNMTSGVKNIFNTLETSYKLALVADNTDDEHSDESDEVHVNLNQVAIE